MVRNLACAFLSTSNCGSFGALLAHVLAQTSKHGAVTDGPLRFGYEFTAALSQPLSTDRLLVVACLHLAGQGSLQLWGHEGKGTLD